ncbi:N-acetyltransferase [Polaribacter pacificus]|uniref:N-acetyltransferase n=1 Tax=Polaribacter pacificus TaxID=1775173 RepID=A0A917HYI5_9FLAO|nr:GNAT family N-acetyltransferase [Polaribacter pacificus]GGG95955.1 N-acetyltransferase [Polaribacter pacificus]
MIVKALSSDATSITQVALISKAYWGYSEAQILSWTDELTVSPEMIQEMQVYVWKEGQKILGFYVLNQPLDNKIELEFLFVLPSFIGKGIGKKLLVHAIEIAKKNPENLLMTLDADPNAAPFYSSQGFQTVGQKNSSIFGRFMPKMSLPLH